jgi:hypothetical protein
MKHLRHAWASCRQEQTREQKAYDNGFLSGAVAVIGLLWIHAVAERRRDRGAA